MRRFRHVLNYVLARQLRTDNADYRNTPLNNVTTDIHVSLLLNSPSAHTARFLSKYLTPQLALVPVSGDGHGVSLLSVTGRRQR